MYKLYFEWICQILCSEHPLKRKFYDNLLQYFYEIEFTYVLPMDRNRAEDGLDLRQRFAYENSYKSEAVEESLSDKPCSVLEMMAALAIRCEEHIMDDPDIGNRTGRWFWEMVASLGLENMDDKRFDREHVDKVVSRFLKRRYRRDGKGGLFIVKNYSKDMRNVEIWYQMCLRLDEIL